MQSLQRVFIGHLVDFGGYKRKKLKIFRSATYWFYLF